MRSDQLTIKAQEALQEAQRDARARGNAELTGDHLLLALLKQEDGVVVPILQKLGANPEVLAGEIAADLSRRPSVSGASADPGMSRELSRGSRPRPCCCQTARTASRCEYESMPSQATRS